MRGACEHSERMKITLNRPEGLGSLGIVSGLCVVPVEYIPFIIGSGVEEPQEKGWPSWYLS